MYKKRKENRKKIIVIGSVVLGILLLLLVGYFANDNRHMGNLEMLLKDTAITFQRWISKPFSKENDQHQTESILMMKGKLASQEQEIQELKNMLELNRTLTEYKIENATILSRNISYWNETITIDKGKEAGLEKNMAVITENGLLGKIVRVTNKSSEVKLITDCNSEYQISVIIHTDQGEVHALLSGYDQENKKAILTSIDQRSLVLPSQEVTTSGLGGVFPRGIYIGTIDKIENDNQSIAKTAEVTLKQDFNKIRYVSILKGTSHD